MAEIYKLRNQIKYYEWGSPDCIPRLLGLEADGEHWAEMWMGSSSVLDSRRSVGEQFGDIPFLFKLLAAEKPLSIQAHPNLAQAGEGFERENRAGLALDAPERNYKDANHKPEIICALTPFTGLCGFRAPDEIQKLLGEFFEPPLITPLMDALAKTDITSSLRNFLEALFSLSQKERTALTEFILSSSPVTEEWKLTRDFARQYPGDPAIIAPVYLNIFHLEPGEAVFLEAGTLHAYIHGFGVELMADSDNVLRGGLTPKHIDVPELLKVLNFTPYKPRLIKPAPANGQFAYPAPCKDFSLTVMRGTDGEQNPPADSGPAICIVTEGEVSVDGMILKQGESAFIPSASRALSVSAVVENSYTLYIATVPR